MTEGALVAMTSPGAEALAGSRQAVPVVLGPGRRPGQGERATGHGVSGTVAAVPEHQPLAGEDIWRVTLAGESFGRLVRRGGRRERSQAWRLLRLDDLTDAQLDAYEAALRDYP